jgi:hypothetical protein
MHSPWVSRALSELGHEVIVAHARNVRLIGESRRKDRLDAQTLARLARIDPQLPCPVRHRSAKARADLTSDTVSPPIEPSLIWSHPEKRMAAVVFGVTLSNESDQNNHRKVVVQAEGGAICLPLANPTVFQEEEPSSKQSPRTVILTFSRCRFVDDSEKFAFDVLCQSIRMPKAGRSEKIRRFHRGNRTAAGIAVDGYPARQHRRRGQVLAQGLRGCQRVADIVDSDFVVQIDPLVMQSVLEIQNVKNAKFMPLRGVTETLLNFLWRVLR